MSKEHNKLVDETIEYLRWEGGLVTDTDASKYGRGAGSRAKVEKGWTDVTACMPPRGKFFVVEVKIGNDKLNPDQIKMRDETIARGGIHVEARSLQDVIDAVKKYKASLKNQNQSE